MNKAELLQKLDEKFHKVLEPLEKGIDDNIKRYKIIVFEKREEALIRREDFFFFVENEGKQDEIAYWNNSEPKPTIPIKFSKEVSNYIQAKIDAGIIEGGFIENIDAGKEIAHGVAIVDVSGGLVEKKILVDKNESDEIRHRVIE